MKKAEWIKVLEAEVEKAFDPAQVDGFENSAGRRFGEAWIYSK